MQLLENDPNVDVRLWLAFGADPEADPETWVFTDVTEDLLAIDQAAITYGRADEESQVSPSSLNFSLANETGAYTPDHPASIHYPNIKLNVPVKLVLHLNEPGSENEYIRYTGFSAAWLPEWPDGDLSDEDADPNDLSFTNPEDPGWARVKLQTAGILRRMQQGEKALPSALRSTLESASDLVAYWPMEDGEDATQFAAASPDTAPMTISGEIDLASAEPPAGSNPLPSFRPGSGFRGAVPTTPPGPWQIRFLLRWPELLGNFRAGMEVVLTDDDFYRVRIEFTTTQLRLRVFDVEGDLTDSITIAYAAPVDTWMIVSMSNQFGLTVKARPIDGSPESPFHTPVPFPAGNSITQMRLGQMGGTPDHRDIGHVLVQNNHVAGTHNEFSINAANGFPGESAGARFERLCDENNVRFRTVGTGAGLVIAPLLGSSATTPAQPYTGNIDIAVEASIEGQDRPPGDEYIPLFGVGDTSSGLDSDPWIFAIDTGNENRLVMNWREANIGDAARSTIPMEEAFSAMVPMRVTVNFDNPSFWVATFYTGDTIDGPWHQFGEQVQGTSTDQFSNDWVTWHAGADGNTGHVGQRSVIKAIHVRQGIDGPLMVAPNFDQQPDGVQQFTDSVGAVWTMTNGARIDSSAILPGETPAMGPQLIAPLTGNLQDCADVDGGIFGETLDDWSVLFRTRRSMTNQDPVLILDAANEGGEIENPLLPAKDDQQVRNDVTVARPEGSSFQAIDEQHIEDNDLYDESITRNVATDDQLQDQAHWRLTLGTWPGMRYPQVSPALSNLEHIRPLWSMVRLGDRIQVINLPPQHPPEGIDVLVQGWSETYSRYNWVTGLNASPAGPWSAFGEFTEDDVSGGVEGLSRFGAVDSTLVAGFTAGTDTVFEVDTPSLPVWINDTDHAEMFPVDVEIRGIQLRVLSITPVVDVFEGFEDATLDISVTGTWARENTPNANTGAWAFRSAVIAADQQSDAVVTVPAGATRIRFAYRVNSEATFDLFQFLVDGVIEFEDSGLGKPWIWTDTIDITGASTVTFRYLKDGSVTEGDDAAWVDDIRFTGIRQTFTVEQEPINGVKRPVSAGELVQLANAARFGY